MWKINLKGQKEFQEGKNNPAAAASEAMACQSFEPDDEDEMTADEAVSCYNCRFRRWTRESFECCK
jgi:hypothetical protein